MKLHPAWLQHKLKRLANQNTSKYTGGTCSSSRFTSGMCHKWHVHKQHMLKQHPHKQDIHKQHMLKQHTHRHSTHTSCTCTSSTHKGSTSCLLNCAYNLLQVLSNMIDYGMEPQAALNAPRFSIEGVDSAYGPACVEHSQYVSLDCSTSCTEPACCCCTHKCLHWPDSL